jgi:hypothetical protein
MSTMNGRSIFVLLALSLSPSMLTACAGDEPSSPSSSSPPKLDGTYRPTQGGPIGSITFTNDRDYLLVPTGCSSGECMDIGTYRFDAQTSTVLLENGESHRVRAIALERIKTSDVASVLIESVVRTADLVDPGEQHASTGNETTTGGSKQVTGNQQELASSGNKLAEKAVELIKTIVEALMNGQGMKKDDGKKDDDEKADEDKPKPNPLDCKQGVPTNESTAAEKLAYLARCPGGP